MSKWNINRSPSSFDLSFLPLFCLSNFLYNNFTNLFLLFSELLYCCKTFGISINYSLTTFVLFLNFYLVEIVVEHKVFSLSCFFYCARFICCFILFFLFILCGSLFSELFCQNSEFERHLWSRIDNAPIQIIFEMRFFAFLSELWVTVLSNYFAKMLKF